jgi:hypothetical protein
MTPPSSYAKTTPNQASHPHSEAPLKHFPANTPKFNTNSFQKKFLFFFTPYIGVPERRKMGNRK